jgi:hypothetical protein
MPTQNTKLQQLEADILELKKNIRQKEKARKGSDPNHNNQCNGNEWKVANRKRPANRKIQSLMVQGKYKLVIGSSDDGTRSDTSTIQKEITKRSVGKSMMDVGKNGKHIRYLVQDGRFGNHSKMMRGMKRRNGDKNGETNCIQMDTQHLGQIDCQEQLPKLGQGTGFVDHI